jgi:pyruvate,water dikinase
MTAPASATPATGAFPIRWEHPGDEDRFWFQDVMHFPTPITPLTQTFQLPAFNEGGNRAIALLSMPILGFTYGAQNHYVYGSVMPFVGTPEEMEARMAQMQQTIGAILPGLTGRFERELIPRILDICREFRETDCGHMSLAEHARFVAGVRDRLVELWDIHMTVNIPPMAGVFGFDEFLAAMLGPDEERTGHLMLQGFPNKSVESGHLMWELAAAARKLGLSETLLNTSASALHTVLAESAPGRAFAERWDAFLKDYGWRSGAFEFADAPWIEDGTVPLNHLRAYLADERAEDPYEAQRRQARERDRLVAETEARLPAEAVPTFRMLLAGAQTYIPLAEDHNFYIDQMAFSSARVPMLSLGKRLAESGAISRRDDVFYLRHEDIEAIAGGATRSYMDEVAARRASVEEARGMVPPEFIGTPPPADAPIDPVASKFFGVGPDLPGDAKTIRGIASSGGTATGVVKVVRTLDEADKLEPGDVLVCHMTMPAWTPLFATVGAVVADSGGVLSHCSIVAREYGIPCVTGTRTGTRKLMDGQRVTVDGNRGLVVLA